MELQYKIAIASHKRLSMIRKKTLTYLFKHNIVPTWVYIFVSPESYLEYKIALEPLGYNIIRSKDTILKTRNHIIDYFDEGTAIMEIDDDLADIQTTLKGQKNEPIKDLDYLIRSSFEMLGTSGIWGVNSNINSFFADGKDKFGLYSIVNSFLGYYNDKRIILEVEEKEDWNRVCLAHQLRLPLLKRSGFGINTRYWKNPGGIQARYDFDRRVEVQAESALKLMEKFPGYCYTRTRKSGIIDLRFRRQKKKVSFNI